MPFIGSSDSYSFIDRIIPNLFYQMKWVMYDCLSNLLKNVVSALYQMLSSFKTLHENRLNQNERRYK